MDPRPPPSRQLRRRWPTGDLVDALQWVYVEPLTRDPGRGRVRAATSGVKLSLSDVRLQGVWRGGKLRTRHGMRLYWRSRGMKLAWRIEF